MAGASCRRKLQRQLRAETAPIGVTGEGPLALLLAAFAVAICNSGFI